MLHDAGENSCIGYFETPASASLSWPLLEFAPTTFRFLLFIWETNINIRHMKKSANRFRSLRTLQIKNGFMWVLT